MRNKLQLVGGSALMLAAIWIGPYTIEQCCPPPSALGFSAVITTIFAVVIGMAMVVDALIRGD